MSGDDDSSVELEWHGASREEGRSAVGWVDSFKRLVGGKASASFIRRVSLPDSFKRRGGGRRGPSAGAADSVLSRC